MQSNNNITRDVLAESLAVALAKVHAGEWGEAERELRDLMHQAEVGGIVDLEVEIGLQRTQLFFHQGQFAEALALSEMCVEKAEQNRGATLCAQAYNARGVVEMNLLGEHVHAQSLFEKALSCLSAAPSSDQVATSIPIMQLTQINLSVCMMKQGKLAEAHEHLTSCQDARLFAEHPQIAFAWFGQNAHLLSTLFHKLGRTPRDLAERARASYLFAINLITHGRAQTRLENVSLYHGALRLAHDMCDPVFGLLVTENYRFGKSEVTQKMPTDLGHVQSALLATLKAHDAAIMSFHIGRSDLFVYLVSSEIQAVFSVAGFDVKQLDDLVVNHWYSPCKDFRDNPTPLSREAWRAAILWARDSLEDLLRQAKTSDGVLLLQALSDLNVKRLVVVPHRHTVVFPLELLRLNAQCHDSSPLGDRFETFSVRNLTSLIRWDERNWKVFNRILFIRSRGEAFPGAELEQRAIQSGPWQCTVRFAETITIKELASLIADHDALHLSCHASVRQSKDMYPSVQLADGYLSVQEIRSWDLSGLKLSSVATCDSAMAKIDAMDSISGLMDAFREAGCSAVNACLWPVPDVSTGLLFTEYYVALAQGCIPSAAMCRAKNWVRNASIEELSARLGQFGLMPLARHSSRRDKALRKEDLESVGMVVETDIDGKTPLLDHPYFWAPFVVMVH